MIRIVMILLWTCAWLVLPVCIIVTRRKNHGWNKALTRRFGLLYGITLGALAAVVIFSVVLGSPNVRTLQNSPFISRIVGSLTAYHHTDADDGGKVRAFYRLRTDGDADSVFPGIGTPCAVIGLKADSEGPPSIAELTLLPERNGSGPLTENELESLRTIFFWLPDVPKTASYQNNGRYSFTGYRDCAIVYAYDVASGTLGPSWTVSAQPLPETATGRPHNRLTRTHFEDLIGSLLAGSQDAPSDTRDQPAVSEQIVAAEAEQPAVSDRPDIP